MSAKSLSGKCLALVCCLAIVLAGAAFAMARPQPPGMPAPAPAETEKPRPLDLKQELKLIEERLMRHSDDLMIFSRLEDIAEVDKIRFTGPPSRVVKNPTAQDAGNRVTLSAFTFMPKKKAEGKRPLLVLVHGGVHGYFNASHIHITRELVAQGYAVIAPEYRGSAGYGKEIWELIDYGGLETEDVFAAKQVMLENHDDLDPARVGILGWSHGGMITLMNLFEHPKDYAVGYAGVPVSDLVARMGYKDDDYRKLFSAPYHIGKTAEQDVKEYRRRSPAWNAEKLQAPLLIHTTTNDEDVNVLEVEHLIKSLKAADKKFEHKVYQDAPGGHDFNRLDTKFARESRAEIYRFLAKHLKPPEGAK